MYARVRAFQSGCTSVVALCVHIYMQYMLYDDDDDDDSCRQTETLWGAFYTCGYEKPPVPHPRK